MRRRERERRMRESRVLPSAFRRSAARERREMGEQEGGDAAREEEEGDAYSWCTMYSTRVAPPAYFCTLR